MKTYYRERERISAGKLEGWCCRLAGREEGRHVVFVLRAVGNYSIVACYHGLSHRLGLILKHGEQRVGYLTQEMRSLIAAQDEVGSLPEDQQEHHFSLATERSHLARDIQNIYHDLCNTGKVRMYINKWLELLVYSQDEGLLE